MINKVFTFISIVFALNLLSGCAQNSTLINIESDYHKFDFKQPDIETDIDFKSMPLEEILKTKLSISSDIEVSIPKNYLGLKNPFNKLSTVWAEKNKIDKMKHVDWSTIPKTDFIVAIIRKDVVNIDGALYKSLHDMFIDFFEGPYFDYTGYKEISFYETENQLPFVVMKINNGFYKLYAGLPITPLVITVSYVNSHPGDMGNLVWFNIVNSLYKTISESNLTTLESVESLAVIEDLDDYKEAENFQSKADEFIEFAKKNELDAIMQIVHPQVLTDIGYDKFREYLSTDVFDFINMVDEFVGVQEITNELDSDGTEAFGFTYQVNIKGGYEVYGAIRIGVVKFEDNYFVNSIFTY